ncbi:MAG: SpoIIE family protein phosphatase [Selenomonadaceae bacterium]|nr:SpoIIE family protein phosphatase [Selenomonadaceae bacterium]
MTLKLKLNIRRRLMLIVLSISIVTLIILGGVAFYGMNGVRNLALKSVEDIGLQSAVNTSNSLEMQKKKELSLLTNDKADALNQRLTVLAVEVRKIADEMSHIQAAPNQFVPQYTPPPDEVFDHEIAFYIQHSATFNVDWFRAEVGLASNIRDFLIRSVETNNMSASMAIASRDGFTLTVDDNHEVPPDDRQEPPLICDVTKSDWYTRASSAGTLIFTDVQRLEFRNTLGFFCATPYRNADGSIAGVACAQASLDRLRRIVEEVSMHDEGFCFVLDNRGRVILSSDKNFVADLNTDLRKLDNQTLADIATQMVDGFKGIREATVDGKRYFISYAPIDQTDWSFAAVLDAAVISEPIVENAEMLNALTEQNLVDLRQHMQSTMIFFGTFVILLLAATAYIGRRLANHFVEPIHRLSDGVREISTGALDKKLEIKTGDEIESLAITFNAMTDRLKRHIANLTRVTADRERISTELNVARNIQVSMLPNVFPPFPEHREFDLYATMHAAKEVGGDFYDFYLLDGDRLVITIADVSGKGVPAALFMVISKTVLKNFAVTLDGTNDLASAVTRANRQLCQNNDEFMFVTVFAALLEIKTGRLVYVNAGHNPPLVRRGDRFEYLELEKSWALGIDETLTFEQRELALAAGDALFLYTDGVTEAMDVDGNQYSERRLIDRLNVIERGATVEEIVGAVANDLKAHVRGAEQSDDITMLALKINSLDGGGDQS